MPIRVTWTPNTDPDIASYLLERSDAMQGEPWVLTATVAHAVPGPAYDAATGVFFFVDADGDSTKYYRLFAVDLAGNKSAPSSSFRAGASTPAITALVRLDADYGGSGALAYLAPNGTPIEGALVRVFKKPDFDLSLPPLGVTTTDTEGRWGSPVYVDAGYTYVIHYSKQGYFGPDILEVVV